VAAAVFTLGAVAIGCVVAAHLLAGASWPRRSPAVAIALWQALGLGWGVATVGTLAGVGASGLRAETGVMSVAAGSARAAGLVFGAGTAARGWDVLTALRLLSLTAGIMLLTLLCWILLAAVSAVLRARQRQRALLGLLAHDDPKVPGALVVDHPAAAAYCVPGLRSAIVISAGALDLLDQAELAAVLAHERAHLRARHDLVLLPFTALLRAFRWSAVAREANREVALLVEMMADDRAQRRLPARELATALLRVGVYGGGGAPTGALAMAGGYAQANGSSADVMARPTGTSAPTIDGELAARVTRLLRPPPGLPVPAVILLGTIAALLVVAPALALLLPM
jgi:Zn-dependent protease with chaperone function